MPVTFTKGSQSVTFDGAIAVRAAFDGNPVIQVPPGGSVTILSWSPAKTGTGASMRNGAVKNPPGSVNANMVNLDGRATTNETYAATATLNLVAGDVLMIGKSTPEGIGGAGALWTPTPYHGASTSVLVESEMVVSVVEFDIQNPPTPTAQLMRPPAFGNNWVSRGLRVLAPIWDTQIDMTKLPSVIDLALVESQMTKPWTMIGIDDVLKIFRDFSGDCMSEWSLGSVIPGYQHPGYGSYFSGFVSKALVLLCSNLTTEQKFPLARAMCQWGLDFVTAWADGRNQYPNGGHMQGRKALIILAGHLVAGAEPFKNPDSFFPANTAPMQESLGYFTAPGGASAWWFGGWPHGWRFHTGVMNGSQLASAPATWGDPNSPQHNTWAWCLRYMNQCCGSQVGSVLAMQLMGLRQQFGDSICGMVGQFMQGPPPAAVTELNAAGCTYFSWGEPYGIEDGQEMVKKAWQLYSAWGGTGAATSPPPLDATYPAP